MTNWFAGDKVVAITSDLPRSYNGSAVQYGNPAKNQRKLSAFTRSWLW